MELKLDTQSGQFGLFDEAEEYDAFIDKFKPKLTTDDCYTPALVFDAVATWVAAERAAAERAAAEHWQLSDRERAILKAL